MQLLSRGLVPILVIAVGGACSHSGSLPQPILEHLAQGQTSVQYDEARDLRACRQEVRAAAPVSIQPRWLPPLGGYTNGIILGTVDSPHPAWPSLEAYRQEMERCLVARGYQIHGWQ
ncbi:MAG TPA: hypothetical protein VEI50_15170 [Nitrospiraceae bacterium]|jgi:hypothetical protein|nr:hypothetical protein [Nitrospiraceae bacterium]